ncbi:DUF4180 domain-containing protein [Actinokineospora auranticolor]|uniref:Uncharacterized protein DUF4180 n=1 Tax=Actinokineospora auranticolor TaxID=155976 RepID=A0A2S6GNT1_9PSEU|nr:DUF4180 domain-containing protein [Actinokineospora auranticolor]PPK66823.1 uncharacterized protein DUF4180 [Actinokineospora auranticolor]
MTVLRCAADGPLLTTADDANDLIGEAWGAGATAVVLPVERLDERFFRLSTGFAGAFIGKFVNYRLVLVVVGDIAAHLERSEALRAFVAEANRGRQFWFAADAAEAETRLAQV